MKKNPFESSENFTAYATIAAGYYMIRQIMADMDKPTSPIEIMVDKATGYGAGRVKEQKEAVVSIAREIIECKKILGEDYTSEVELIEKIEQTDNHS